MAGRAFPLPSGEVDGSDVAIFAVINDNEGNLGITKVPLHTKQQLILLIYNIVANFDFDAP